MNGIEPAPVFDREAWLAERRTGIGASDAAAILGFSPWRTPLDVWLDKTGQAPPFEETEPIWWGRALEDLVAQRYGEKTGAQVWNPARLYRHPRSPIILATPDRIIVNEAGEPQFGLEVKTARVAEEWGRPGSDEVPAHYLIQCLQCMAVLDLDRWDVAVLVGGSDHRIYSTRRDPAFEARILEMLEAWWARHIVGGERPAISGSDSARQWLAWKYPQDSRPILPASPEALALVEELDLARSASGGWEERKQQAENRLKALLEDAAGLEGETAKLGRFRVTWKSTEGRTRVDWQAVAERVLEDLRRISPPGEADAAFDIFLDKHSERVPGPRRFLYRRLKGDAR
jgi:putative phage-type endonuclease